MRLLLLSITLLLMAELKAQTGVESLVQAERNFAAFSVEQGMKDAFLHFMDSNAVVFDKGNPVNALKFWTLREKRPGILNWHPIVAEISASGDFGYTSGPWTFQPGTLKD